MSQGFTPSGVLIFFEAKFKEPKSFLKLSSNLNFLYETPKLL